MNFERTLINHNLNFKLFTYFALFKMTRVEYLSEFKSISLQQMSYCSQNHIEIKSIHQMSKYIYFDATEQHISQ